MLFQKQGNGSELFKKIANDKNLFRKFDNTARKVDNSVARIGAFIKPVANMAHMGGYVDDVVNGVHAVRNGLEKATKTPMSQIRGSFA